MAKVAERYLYVATFTDASWNEVAMKEEAKPELSQDDIRAIVEISKERAMMMRELKTAVIDNDPLKVMEIARKVCGVEEPEVTH